MKRHLLHLAMATALAIGTAGTSAAGVFSPFGNQAQNDKNNPFRFMPTKERRNTITPEKLNRQLGLKSVTQLEPDQTLTAPYCKEDQMRTAFYVYGPNEEEWFYTMETYYEALPGSNEYFIDKNYNGMLFTLYNEKGEKMGSFKGNVPLIEGAKRCYNMQVDLTVTKNFYNFDDYYEITIGCNYNPIVGTGAKQVTYVYSLNNKTEAQDPLYSIPGLPGFEMNIGTATAENFVMMFMDYSTWPDDDPNKITYTVYTRWSYGSNGPTKVEDFPILSVSGSEAVPMQMAANGTKLYAASAIYEKPFYGSEEDETTQNGNNYVITLYEQDRGKFNEVKQTKIPVPDVMEGYVSSEVSLGTFRGTGDITFEFGDGKLPCYVLEFTQTSSTNDAYTYYAVYDTDGKELKRFGENGSGRYMQLSNIDGCEEQYAFFAEKDGTTVLQMMNWPSLTLGATLPVSLYDPDSGETFNLSSNLDRCPGKGGYYYVSSSATGETNDKNTIHRIAYFDGNGNFDHIDALTFSAEVTSVQPYIDASVLDPYLFNSDKNFEYLVWMQRKAPANPAILNYVLGVVDSKGNILAEREYDLNAKGQRFWAFVSNVHSGSSYLCVTYDYNYGFSQGIESRLEMIKLPFNQFEGEGTVENPYLIKSYGDFNQIRNNLTSHFRLAADIDGEGRTMLQIPGVFKGSIDGAGHQVRNIVIAGSNDNNGMFYQFGEEGSATKSFLKNITFSNLSMHITFQAYRVKADGMLAYQFVNSDLDNVHLLNATATTEFGTRNTFDNPVFGGFAARINGCSINESSVLNADFNMPNSYVGGIGGNFIGEGSEVNACAFTGKIVGKNNVGGIAGYVNVATNINDVHVNADITGAYRVGGVLGFADQGAAYISRALVEGSVTSDEPQVDSYITNPDKGENEDYVYADANYHYVGGIAGDLYAGWVHNSVVALDNLAWMQNDSEYNFYIGRIVGTGSNQDCYALNTITGVGDEYRDGTDVAKADLTGEWFTNLGFAAGATAAAPWNHAGELPALYFEETAALYLGCDPAEYEGAAGTTVDVVVKYEGFDLAEEIGSGLVQFGTANEAIAEMNGNMEIAGEGMVTIQLDLKAAGETTFTITAKGKTATATITVKDLSGIAGVTAEQAQPNDPVYNLQGIKVGTREGFENLPAGLYIMGGQKILKR